MPAGRRFTIGLAAFAVLALSALAAAGASPAAIESVDFCPAEGGCRVEGGHYRIVLPQKAAGPRSGAIMFFHGWQGSAEEAISDAGLLGLAQRLGVALIAPDGMGKTWSYPGSPGHHRDEFVFVGRVLDDVAQRFPVDPGRIMASGISQGGSIVWYMACQMPTRFAGFAPIAGAFWEPLPQDCAGPRPKLIHVHGTSDMTVPLAGRALRSGYRQGDVFRSLAILAPNGCTAPLAAQAQEAVSPPGLACRLATGCGGSARLELCLHSGGHIADPVWIERAWSLLMAPEAVPATAGVRLTIP